MIAERASRVMMELQNLPEVEYPVEVIRELDEIAEETMTQFSAGEIAPLTAAEFAAEVRRRRSGH